jgi:CRISPR-associated endonuclease/helicase Cas3
MEKGRLFVFDSGDDESLKGWLKRMADIGAEVIRTHSDFLSPEAVRHYFERLYGTMGELDTKGIVDAMNEGARSLSFPFERIADEFQLIDDRTLSLVVPYQPEIVEDLVAKISSGLDLRKSLRRIQRHVVQVSVYQLRSLENERAVVPLIDGLFRLIDPRYYRTTDRGLVTTSEEAGPLQTMIIQERR